MRDAVRAVDVMSCGYVRLCEACVMRDAVRAVDVMS
jgi:hypothetical protein